MGKTLKTLYKILMRPGMKKLIESIASINKTMKDFGFDSDICLKTNNVEITGKEVIITMPYKLTLRLPKEEFGENGLSENAISRAVSRAVNLNK